MRTIQIVLGLLLLAPTLFQAHSICPPGCDCSEAGDIIVCEPSAGATECPCFSAAMIQYNHDQCSGAVTPTCSLADPSYMLISCDVPPPTMTGMYVQYISATNCSRNDDYAGDIVVDPTTAEETQACVDEIVATGYCP